MDILYNYLKIKLYTDENIKICGFDFNRVNSK